MSVKGFVELFKDAANEWSEDKASRLAAALAYYTIFSLAPMLIIVIAVAGLVYSTTTAQGELMQQIQGLVGQAGAEAIQQMLESASKPASGIFASLVGLLALMFGATGAFTSLQDGLDTVWGVTPKPGQSWWKSYVLDRLQSFALVLAIGFLLLVSLIVSAALAAATKFMTGWIGSPWVLEVINLGVSFIVITILFAMMYKILPSVRIAWSDVWIGAAVTSLLFSIGKSLIGLYLGHSSVGSTYGAAGSLVVILVWVYYSAQILFFGAEVTQVYANRYGSQIVPKENVVPISDEARGKQGLHPKRRAV